MQQSEPAAVKTAMQKEDMEKVGGMVQQEFVLRPED